MPAKGQAFVESEQFERDERRHDCAHFQIPIRPPSDPTDPVAIILARMRSHPDPKALVTASLNEAMNEIAGLNIGREVPALLSNSSFCNVCA